MHGQETVGVQEPINLQTKKDNVYKIVLNIGRVKEKQM